MQILNIYFLTCTTIRLTLVSIGPGEMQLNLMPYWAHSKANDLAKCKILNNEISVQCIEENLKK